MKGRRPDRGIRRHGPAGRRSGAVVIGLLCASAGACQPEGEAEWMDASVEEPRVFAPDVVSTDQREYGITFTPDGREAYFTRRPRRGPPRILVSRFDEGRWSEPEPASFAEIGDQAPYIAEDGGTLLFSSRRRLHGSPDRSDNIWLTRREDGDWSDPVPLPGTVNQPGNEIDDFDVGMELGPFLAGDGVLLYWTRVTPDWGSDIYVALSQDDGWGEPRPLLINSSGEESNPILSPDGRYLIFQAYRDVDGYGDDDLYVAERTEYGWAQPRPLPPPINSSEEDGHPRFSPDGRHFFFSSDRDARYPDIYIVDTEALGLEIRTR